MNLKEHLLSREAIALQVDAKDWKAAVKAGTDMLVKAGTIEPRYYEEIIQNTQELGPYYLLAPGLAMPHARPEGGVIENSFALVTLKEPVAFGDPDNDPIDILITLAARDAKTQNEEAIVQVVTLLDNEETIEKLRGAKTLDDIKILFEELD
ncbi:MAG: PTS sugar transporter subunit IIA [Sphaerochaetaceae bacterium]|nr:PTS sugar transporter subunit IIA [Sphaerochaetaceae bacterium]MDC7238532.1 PTS sugar transporter subunit IIA [Sphaerochaetaceae bacterium]MDC7242448.1 PTS sugar transporter subunit IIA [Sphaerochaetaceae bacterium]MDC7248822.1 PTS sugar transporter subunit IIA [Sphaerochaetaceae bacterium]